MLKIPLLPGSDIQNRVIYNFLLHSRMELRKVRYTYEKAWKTFKFMWYSHLKFLIFQDQRGSKVHTRVRRA